MVSAAIGISLIKLVVVVRCVETVTQCCDAMPCHAMPCLLLHQGRSVWEGLLPTCHRTLYFSEAQILKRRVQSFTIMSFFVQYNILLRKFDIN